MKAHIYHSNEESHAAFFDAIKYWSNALGELHHHGEYDITEEDLPGPLQRAYNDLYYEGCTGSLRYLVETKRGYGVALLNEYDEVTAENSGLPMDLLFRSMSYDAAAIAADPAFAKAEVFAGEHTGVCDCHDLIVVFPADIPVDEFTIAVNKLDSFVYSAVKAADLQESKITALAERLVAFCKDFDFYEYQDSLQVGEAEMDAVAHMVFELHSEQKVSSLVAQLKEISNDGELSAEQQKELSFLIEGVSSLFQDAPAKPRPSLSDLVESAAARANLAAATEREPSRMPAQAETPERT